MFDLGQIITTSVVGFVGAFVLTALLTRLAIQLCLKLGHVAPPDPWHTKPIALSAGTAVWVGFTAFALALTPLNIWTLAVIGGASAMFAVGLFDDIRPFRADLKFLLQLVISAAVVAMGVKVGLIPAPAAIPLTIFWMVGLTNAVNLIDNMDGLSPGVSAIAAGFLGLLALTRGDLSVAALSFSLAGACTGFLLFNLPPARAFLGDAGSLFLGFSLASIGILSTWESASSLLLTLALPVLVLWVPIFNTTFVTITRILLKVPIAKGQGDHINYRLLAYGLTAKHAVWLVYGLAIAGGGLAMLYTQMDNRIAVAVAILVTVVVFVLGAFLFEGDISNLYAKFDIESDNSWAQAIRRYRSFGMMLADLCLISAAYFAAYLIRFEGDVPPHQFETFIGTLPVFLAIRLIFLALFGMYQRYWRYVSVSDLVVLVQAVVLSSLVQVGIVLMFRLPAFSRSVMILDALLCFVALGGVRMSTRVLRNYVQAFRAQLPGTGTLVIGAGDAGELALRELRNNSGQGLRAVGILDDDPAKKRAKIHGVSVVGTISEMAEVADRLGVNNLLLAVPSASRARKDEILLLGDSLGLTCYEFWVASSLRRVVVDDDGRGNRRLMTSDIPVLVTDDDPAAVVGG
ncbi:MAG: hypothetical protein VX498_05950 [Myxococcota bacterium]|nr:hypothetical protein [Myxococcota bacterium]